MTSIINIAVCSTQENSFLCTWVLSQIIRILSFLGRDSARRVSHFHRCWSRPPSLPLSFIHSWASLMRSFIHSFFQRERGSPIVPHPSPVRSHIGWNWSKNQRFPSLLPKYYSFPDLHSLRIQLSPVGRLRFGDGCIRGLRYSVLLMATQPPEGHVLLNFPIPSPSLLNHTHARVEAVGSSVSSCRSCRRR